MGRAGHGKEPLRAGASSTTAACARAHAHGTLAAPNTSTDRVQMLLQRVHSNDDEIRRLRLDLDDQSSSRIMYQQQAADYMARNEEYKRLIVRVTCTL